MLFGDQDRTVAVIVNHHHVILPPIVDVAVPTASSPRHINLLPAYHRVAAAQAATDNKSRNTIHVFIADRSFDRETAAHKDQEYGSRTPVGYRDREMKGDVTYKDEDRFVALTLDCLSDPAGVDDHGHKGHQ